MTGIGLAAREQRLAPQRTGGKLTPQVGDLARLPKRMTKVAQGS
jgi:hypothetical protein